MNFHKLLNSIILIGGAVAIGNAFNNSQLGLGIFLLCFAFIGNERDLNDPKE